MEINVYDAGSSYIVKDENLVAAYRWLEEQGEWAFVVAHNHGKSWLSADGHDEMFCGCMSERFYELPIDFLRLFCEPNSYACMFDDFSMGYSIFWKGEDGSVHTDTKEAINPFAEKATQLFVEGMRKPTEYRGFEAVDVSCADEVEHVYSVTAYFDFGTEEGAQEFFSRFNETSEIGREIGRIIRKAIG